MVPGVRPAQSPGARIERVTTILAFLFVLGVLVFVHELGHFVAARVIGSVKAGSPAERAGLRRGDRILAVADTKVDTWDKFDLEIGTRPNREVELSYLRNGQTESTSLRAAAEGKYEVGDIGVLPDATPMVTSLVKGDVAEKAGLKPRDLLIAVNGEPMLQPSQLREAISRNAGKETDILVRRSGQEQHIS